VANLSSHKKGWDARWEEFSRHAERGQAVADRLLALVDADTDAFHAVMNAWRKPEDLDAMQAAVRGAIETPLAVMETSLEAMEVCSAMAEHGLKASASDAGVGAMCARLAVRAAGLNVRINLKDLSDEAARRDYLARARVFEQQAETAEADVLTRIALD
ncbi:MAG: cyclodeaminase/cyclohydrolase family protein, partial [Planctomycetota bacterium]|nr:cyclodeaminase/cyclohydrolase family protein [Planctomycetota bacterium]